jgi:hypothetical protein
VLGSQRDEACEGLSCGPEENEWHRKQSFSFTPSLSQNLVHVGFSPLIRPTPLPCSRFRHTPCLCAGVWGGVGRLTAAGLGRVIPRPPFVAPPVDAVDNGSRRKTHCREMQKSSLSIIQRWENGLGSRNRLSAVDNADLPHYPEQGGEPQTVAKVPHMNARSVLWTFRLASARFQPGTTFALVPKLCANWRLALILTGLLGNTRSSMPQPSPRLHQ